MHDFSGVIFLTIFSGASLIKKKKNERRESVFLVEALLFKNLGTDESGSEVQVLSFLFIYTGKDDLFL